MLMISRNSNIGSMAVAALLLIAAFALAGCGGQASARPVRKERWAVVLWVLVPER